MAKPYWLNDTPQPRGFVFLSDFGSGWIGAITVWNPRLAMREIEHTAGRSFPTLRQAYDYSVEAAKKASST